MIYGIVNNRREAGVILRLRGPSGNETRIRAAVDTGYNGALTVSKKLVDSLGLIKVSTSQADLADGSTVNFNTFYLDLEWNDEWRTVQVSQVGDESLLGTRLLLGHELKIIVIPGGDVIISPLPGSN